MGSQRTPGARASAQIMAAIQAIEQDGAAGNYRMLVVTHADGTVSREVHTEYGASLKLAYIPIDNQRNPDDPKRPVSARLAPVPEQLLEIMRKATKGD